MILLWNRVNFYCCVLAVQCKDKWIILRTQKRNIYNHTKKIKSGSGRESIIKWEYYKLLSFLEPYFATGT